MASQQSRSTLVPFDDAIIMIPVRPKPFGPVWTPGNLDNERRVGKVIAVGPGKLRPFTKKLLGVKVSRRDDLPAPKHDPLRASAVEGDEFEQLEMSDVVRLPMNVKVGDYVIFSQAMSLEPDGPNTPTLMITRNEFITCRLDGFEEHDENLKPPNLAVPVPQAIVDPVTGRPFIGPKGGAPRA